MIFSSKIYIFQFVDNFFLNVFCENGLDNGDCDGDGDSGKFQTGNFAKNEIDMQPIYIKSQKKIGPNFQS